MKVNPRIHHDELLYYLSQGSPKKIKSTRHQELVKKLTGPIVPSQKDEYDTRWFCFYVPAKRSGREIAIPMSIVKYKNTFFVSLFKIGQFEVSRGKEPADDFYETVLREAIRLLRLMKSARGKVVERLVPYDYRVGRIKGKYVMEKTMTEGEKEKILKSYLEHQTKNLTADGGCSLDEYLDVAATCYQGAFGKKVSEKKPLDMYRRYADGRHGGMLEIKDRGSRKEFMRWYKGGRWAGSHPFEIVFSWHRHGIHLYPPTEDNGWNYNLRVTNYAYAGVFLKMVRALIEHGIPFTASGLEDVLNYLTGETYFSVNEYSEHMFDYFPSREYRQKYFRHIEWEPLELPKWKS